MNFKMYDQFIDQNVSDSIAELSELCAQPSVSATKEGLHECAALVGEMLEKRGFDVEIAPTSSAPVVFAERKKKTPVKPCCFITIMMCSRLSRWNYGIPRHLNRP